jgi:hypothetical protein
MRNGVLNVGRRPVNACCSGEPPPQTTGEMARSLMNEAREELDGHSLATYAAEVGGVYIWSSAQESEHLLWKEELRFLCDDLNNPILRWNPNGVVFENRTCPYGEREDHGFVYLTRLDCTALGLHSFYLADDEFQDYRQCHKLEHCCQLVIDDLALGTQRLHRVAGAGSGGIHPYPGRMVVGATVLPPEFFASHQDIVIVDSARKRARDYI